VTQSPKQGVVRDERALERVQLVRVREALDRHDLRRVGRDREHEAGGRAPAVEQPRARAALAVVAAPLRAGEAEVLAQQIEQRGFACRPRPSARRR
jgi:hypothetical protein